MQKRRPKILNHVERKGDEPLRHESQETFYPRETWNNAKAAYAPYTYEAEGDPFTRGVCELPRVYERATHRTTERAFIRLLSVSEVRSLSVSEVQGAVPTGCRMYLNELTLYFHASESEIGIYVADLDNFRPPDSVEVRMTKTKQRRGQRLWFLCPDCGRRTGKLYDLCIEEETLWGCRVCLGLTYPSQQQNRCSVQDMLIDKGWRRAAPGVRVAACERQRGREERIQKQVQRMKKSCLKMVEELYKM